MNNTSKTNWEKVDALTEEEIDTSDIPPLTEEFFSKSRWWKPVGKTMKRGWLLHYGFMQRRIKHS